MKSVTLLGATGSIGSQTIELIEEYKHDFQLEAISAYSRIDDVKDILKSHNIHMIAMPSKYEETIKAIAPHISFHALEDDGLLKLSEREDDLFINALVGGVGLKPTLHALNHDKDVLLANKESLVIGGPLIKDALKNTTAKLIPIDSEHAALKACLKGHHLKDVERMVITASGGSLRDVALSELKNVSKADVLKHPNWSMGAKITVDSATMMNKVFEVIEAHYLFDVSYDKIEAILHKESIVHAMIQYTDGNVLSHMGPADMKIPILSAMQQEEIKRYHSVFDLTTLSSLHFEPLDQQRYPLFGLGLEVARQNGMHVVTLNAANEVAVDLFLKDIIPFIEIETVIVKCLDAFDNHEPITLQNVLDHDARVRTFAYNLFN